MIVVLHCFNFTLFLLVDSNKYKENIPTR